MGPGAGGIFDVGVDTDWGEWRRTISFRPRKSITGEWIFGWINKRGKYVHKHAKPGKPYRIHKVRIHEWATNKELFTAILKGTK